jgi:hypothetical protein
MVSIDNTSQTIGTPLRKLRVQNCNLLIYCDGCNKIFLKPIKGIGIKGHWLILKNKSHKKWEFNYKESSQINFNSKYREALTPRINTIQEPITTLMSNNKTHKNLTNINQPKKPKRTRPTPSPQRLSNGVYQKDSNFDSKHRQQCQTQYLQTL